MQEIYLATTYLYNDQKIAVFCLKSKDHPKLVLPILCPADLAGAVWAEYAGELPPYLSYHVLNDVLCADGSYISGVEFCTVEDENLTPDERALLKQKQMAMIARIMRQKKFRIQTNNINTAEAIVFAYVNNYPMFCSDQMMKLFTPTEMVFTDRVTKEQFDNDYLLHRRGQ